MIQANELRIGNYILYLDELYIIDGFQYVEKSPLVKYRVHFKTIDGKLRNSKMQNWINPIPLTKELLEKCGFKDPAENGWALRLGLNSIDELCWYRQDNSLRYQTKDSGFTRNYNTEYLHQLQNLYFDLVGEELTIEL
jgi:hypothetical protein